MRKPKNMDDAQLALEIREAKKAIGRLEAKIDEKLARAGEDDRQLCPGSLRPSEMATKLQGMRSAQISRLERLEAERDERAAS